MNARARMESLRWSLKRLLASPAYQLVVPTVTVGLGVYFFDVATDIRAAYSYYYG